MNVLIHFLNFNRTSYILVLVYNFLVHSLVQTQLKLARFQPIVLHFLRCDDFNDATHFRTPPLGTCSIEHNFTFTLFQKAIQGEREGDQRR